MSDLEGTTIGPYQIGKSIGQGGMAAIYQATDTRDGRPVAVKVLLPQLGGQAELVERFQREARHAATLQHPHIVPIYRQGQLEDGRPYIVMAWIEGGSLANLLSRTGGPLPLSQTVQILTEVASALDYAHQYGMVHLDVKPSNILLTGDGHAMLADFGAGVRLGTPFYMAPEQARDGQVGAWTDVYALGVVLYEMLTGMPPFQGDTDAVLYQHVHEPLPPLRGRNPTLPPALEGVLRQALAKEPQGRYRSAGQLASAFQSTPQPRSRLALALASVAGLAIVALAAVMLLLSPPKTTTPTWRPSPTVSDQLVVGVTPATTVSPEAGGLTGEVATSAADAAKADRETPGVESTVSERLTLLEPPDGFEGQFGTGDVAFAWAWRELEPGERFRLVVRSVEGGQVLSLTDRCDSQAAECTLAGLSPGTYQWLVLAEKGSDGAWQEVTRSAVSRFAILPPASGPTRTRTPMTESAAPEPTHTAPQATPSHPRAPAAVPTPVLVAPPQEETALSGMVTTFQWRWEGTLQEGWGFEIVMWKEGETPTGARDARELAWEISLAGEGLYTVAMDVTGAYAVQRHGPGEYLWSVRVVQYEPEFKPISEVARPAWKLMISSPGEPGRGSGSSRSG